MGLGRNTPLLQHSTFCSRASHLVLLNSLESVFLNSLLSLFKNKKNRGKLVFELFGNDADVLGYESHRSFVAALEQRLALRVGLIHADDTAG